ncbi:flagellar biosynthesis protein FlhF [Niameybacter massiliensis]|uniref:Flagellar biosynthesis protein FlhF n=1 Tax=Holtiella tumoricola TaxID=3018743 RepID=A0AA42DPS5_9FIRM|nr:MULTISPECIES: flagellar biosynthesis protein FlhF [Lachnospirales]MDA3732606.1 flagellar biosynthesis protein FlhF [Holtiella tumoricola]
MRILKIKGKDEQTVLAQIKKEYGEDTVIISTQLEKQQGMMGFFKKPTCSITIAVQDEEEIEEKPTSVSDNYVEETKGMFDYLKNQIDFIKKDIAKVKDLSETKQVAMRDTSLVGEKTQVSITQGGSLYNIMKEKLTREGIQEDVVAHIVSGLEDEENLEIVARKLYEQMDEIMPTANLSKELPKVIVFIGSTGVGKTTTIAKLTADYVMNKRKKVALFTADTYRIAAIEQLKTYAEILDVPIEVIYSENDLDVALEKWKDSDHIFIDTAGRSHKNKEQIEDLARLLQSIGEKQVYLVLNVNTNYKDVKHIVDVYKEFAGSFQLIITKLDETDEIGNLMNIVAYAKSPISYVTDGQNVPDDIRTFDCDEYVKALLGRINHE